MSIARLQECGTPFHACAEHKPRLKHDTIFEDVAFDALVDDIWSGRDKDADEPNVRPICPESKLF